jgi:hypothetical protein
MSRGLWHISRRTFLRGAGAAIGLPLLDAMTPARRLIGATAAVKPPVRLACLFFPNGVWQDAWIPKETGSEFTLPPSLEPLADHRKDVLVLSGLDKAQSRDGDGHYAKTANFLTGLHVTKTTGKQIDCGGASLDQAVARQIGGATPLPSLELGIDPVISGIDSNVGYTRLYGSFISWETATRPVAKEINPRMAYERLFGQPGGPRLGAPKAGGSGSGGSGSGGSGSGGSGAVGGPGAAANEARSRDDFRSLLDAALDDARRLRARVGRDDQFKLDEYLDSVRCVERRIEFASRADAREWQAAPGWENQPVPPPGVPHDFREHARLMLDMIVLAFWSDSTRVSTFMFANDVSPRNFGFLEGVRGGHHEISHHENNHDKVESYKKINRWHTEQFAAMLDRMRAVREGEGTLLDNSMLLFGCGMSDGNRHDPNNLPILLAGRGGGTIDSGRHVASPSNTPLCNLYVSLLERAGAPAEKFGDSTGPLKELSL